MYLCRLYSLLPSGCCGHKTGKADVYKRQVAARCGIARTTLYKYFPDKESLLWAIQHQAFSSLGLALRARQTARPLTALERFAAYFEELVCRFELDPDFIRFLDLF